MKIIATFITRYVADHAPAVEWYSAFFGREPDAAPLANCREWHQPGGVIFQVIHHPDQAGTQSFAFAVDGLDGEVARTGDAGLALGESWNVDGFEGVRYVPFTDPEGVATGLLNKAG